MPARNDNNISYQIELQHPTNTVSVEVRAFHDAFVLDAGLQSTVSLERHRAESNLADVDLGNDTDSGDSNAPTAA